MNGRALPVSERAAQLRRDFDRSFAEPPAGRPAAPVDLLAIRLGTEPYALRLSEIAGLFADKKLTRLPDSVPEFLGLAGFRGSVVPVYDLRVLLGHAGGEAPRWLVIAVAGMVALAFDGFDGHLRLGQEGIAQPEPGIAKRPHVRALARPGDDRSALAGTLRPIVDLASVVEAIGPRASGAVPPPQPER
jgi:purine-binding chemotaxis protein CheW